jgi:hypothetical protein
MIRIMIWRPLAPKGLDTAKEQICKKEATIVSAIEASEASDEKIDEDIKRRASTVFSFVAVANGQMARESSEQCQLYEDRLHYLEQEEQKYAKANVDKDFTPYKAIVEELASTRQFLLELAGSRQNIKSLAQRVNLLKTKLSDLLCLVRAGLRPALFLLTLGLVSVDLSDPSLVLTRPVHRHPTKG